MASLGLARTALRLLLLPGLGERTLKVLSDRYGDPGEVLAALRRGAAQVPPPEAYPPAWRRAIALARGALDSASVRERAEAVLEETRRAGGRFLILGQDVYPERLAELPDPPFVLFARGRPALLRRRCVAVVGTRRSTSYGEEVTRAVAGLLAREGLVVVSGLARGIDSFAHEAALSGGTIGVLGCGIDIAYPRRNATLQRSIAEHGLILSEFPPGTPPAPHNFPRRNRIIAALSELVVVVEAPLKSGALITARHAMELGRDVMGVPGLVGRASAAGVNRLVQDGALMLTDPSDVLFALQIRPAKEPPLIEQPPPDLGRDAVQVWRALHQEAGHIDEVAARAGLSPAAALNALLELELSGHARHLGGKRYARALAA